MDTNVDSGFATQTLKGIARFAVTREIRRTGIAKHVRLMGGLLFLALSASLVAETHFCVGGDLDGMSAAAVTACQAKLSGVRNAAKLRGVPADWHFVVVCDETGWKDYTSFSQAAGLLSGASYSTDAQLRWTFLRGSQLNVDQPQTAATMLSMALESVPSHNQFAPSAKTARQLSIATTRHSNSKPVSQ